MTTSPPNSANRLETLQWISEEYYGLNGTHYEILPSPPTPLEFSRLVHISRPVLIQGCTLTDPSTWSNSSLVTLMGDRTISVAVTPDGFADAVTKDEDGKSWFVEPCVEQMTMEEFMCKLEDPNSKEIHYLQSQNGNLYSSAYFDSEGSDSSANSASEFEPFRQYVPPDIDWCGEALDKRPDAVNLWIGTGASVTSIHSDPYENVYHVVRGSKTFTLIPPTEGWCLRDHLPQYVNTRSHSLTNTLLADAAI